MIHAQTTLGDEKVRLLFGGEKTRCETPGRGALVEEVAALHPKRSRQKMAQDVTHMARVHESIESVACCCCRHSLLAPPGAATAVATRRIVGPVPASLYNTTS